MYEFAFSSIAANVHEETHFETDNFTDFAHAVNNSPRPGLCYLMVRWHTKDRWLRLYDRKNGLAPIVFDGEELTLPELTSLWKTAKATINAQYMPVSAVIT